LKDHYAPTPSKYVQRYEFRQRLQQEGESISEYVAALRKAATQCEYRDLDEMLLEQLICGVRDGRLQRRLLARSNLTLLIALDEARAQESSVKAAERLKSSHLTKATQKTAPVHREASRTARREPRDGCASCGGSHSRQNCKFRDAVCRACKKRGHIARVCRSKAHQSYRPRGQSAQSETAPHRRPNRDGGNRKGAKFEDVGAYTIRIAQTCTSPGEKTYTTLTMQGGCLLWGDRVVIPSRLKEKVLTLLHEGHPGIVRMKGLARSYVWWPSMDADITEWVGKCQPCQESRSDPPTAPVREWERPQGPWSRIHIDFAGPFHGQTFMVIVDAFSKWLEIKLMKATTTDATIRELRQLFATHGLPDILVSDNGPQFTATQFEGYLERVDKFLLAQHSTPCTATGRSPAELLMGRKLRGILDRLNPNYSPEVFKGGERKLREFTIGTPVHARNYGQGPLWEAGTITEITGPKSYRVDMGDGRVWRRHIDQLRKRVRLVRQLRPFLDRDDRRTVTHALVTSRLDYCNSLYVGLPLGCTRRLQLIQNAAARSCSNAGGRAIKSSLRISAD
ncbi:uncharacterized protein, partial [Pituophis catenifer annectens]|uniref:uncharacterized protein n=1 Tax=Pituophis catenifer annectens TaxID=94852 RepID=UPI0039956EF9